VQQWTGDDQIESRLLGVLLETRSGIEDVPDEDDLLLEIAELAGRHRAAVQSAAEAGHSPEIELVPVRVALDSRRKASLVSRLKMGVIMHAMSMTVATCRMRIRARAVPTWRPA